LAPLPGIVDIFTEQFKLLIFYLYFYAIYFSILKKRAV